VYWLTSTAFTTGTVVFALKLNGRWVNRGMTIPDIFLLLLSNRWCDGCDTRSWLRGVSARVGDAAFDVVQIDDLSVPHSGARLVGAAVPQA
jgi:hypothetical protein